MAERAHGTYNKYCNDACRCEPCREAARQHVREYRSRPGVKEADAARHRAQRQTNPEKFRNRELLKKYGINRAQRSEILEAQDRVCAICESSFGDRGPAIDHDHATGLVRRLLCIKCNTGLGAFNDDPRLLRRAALYLRFFTLLHLHGGGTYYVPGFDPPANHFSFVEDSSITNP